MKAKCKVCEKLIDRIKDINKTKRRYKYKDSDGKLWNGKTCPACFLQKVKLHNPPTHHIGKACQKCKAPLSINQRKFCSKECRAVKYVLKTYSWTCQHCRCEFSSKRLGDPIHNGVVRFCSGSCRDSKARLDRGGLLIGEGKCTICSNPYKKNKISDRACKPCKQATKDRAKAKLDSNILKKECKRCNTPFIANNALHKYCSTECSGTPKKNKECTECGTPFYPNGPALRCEGCRSIIKPYPNCKTCNKQCSNRGAKHCSKKCVPKSESAKEARRARKRMERERKLRCISWKDIAEYKKNRPDGYHLDHIIPVNHPLVSGLHIPVNFQFLSPEDNHRKSNQFDGTHENEGWRN